MALSDHVSILITQDSLGIARAGFGTPGFLSYNADFTERVRFYTELSGLADDGFATDSPEYLAAQAAFSQSPHVERFAILRGTLPPTQEYLINTASLADRTEYTINVIGEGVTETEVSYSTSFTFSDLTASAVDATDNEFDFAAPHGLTTGDGPVRLTTTNTLPTGLDEDTDYWVIAVDTDSISFAASRADALVPTEIDFTGAGSGTIKVVATATTSHNPTNDSILAALATALNAVEGANYTATVQAGAGDTDTLEVVADAAGSWFSLEVNPTYLNIGQTHSNPGVETDLAAIQLENDEWYGLCTAFNSPAYVLAAAAWIEAQAKVYVFDVNETDSITVAEDEDNEDTLQEIFNSAYSRTMGAYHPAPAEMMAAAWLGRCLPLEPGSETWKFKTLAGVEAVTLTATHRNNLVDRNANSYQRVAGVNITWEGTTADGDFLDVRRGLDWLTDDMQKGVFGVLAGAEKIPYTDAGVARIEAEVRASLRRAVARQILADDPEPTVTVPRVADVSTNDKALRLLPDVKFSATLAGAVHKVNLRGVVSV